MKKLQRIISLVLVCLMIISPNNAYAASKNQNNIPVTKLTVKNENNYGSFTIAKGKSKQISISVAPSTATNKTLKWTSSDKSIVTVSAKGKINGIKNGKATITAASTDGSNIKKKISVVVGTPVTKITASKSSVSITEGKTTKITTKVEPSKASNKELAYKSLDESIATVSGDGVISGISAGSTSIYAVSKDGNNIKATVKVTVKATTESLILSDSNVVDGKITVKNKTLLNLTINSSVGDAQITLDNVKVRGNLEMSNDASYTVSAKNSEIKNVVALEEEQVIKPLAYDPSKVSEGPTFVAEKGTLVVTVDARGTVTIKQDEAAQIGTVSISRNSNGNLSLNLEGFSGNLVVNSSSSADIAIVTKSCNIAEATISGDQAGQKLTLTDASEDGKQSAIGKVNVETSAAISLAIPAQELAIAETLEAAKLSIDSPIEKIVNKGTSTVLEVNSNVSNIVSNGNALSMTVAAGSQVAEITSSGSESTIVVASGSVVNNIMSTGDSASISGTGKINVVQVQGNNTVIENEAAAIKVFDNVSGTKLNGEELAAGTIIGVIPTPTVTPKPSATPKVTATPTPKATTTPKASITPTPKVTATPTPKATATPTPTSGAIIIPPPAATVTPSPTATPTPKVTTTPSPTVTTAPTTPSPKPTAAATPSPKPTAAATPAPTATAAPTPTTVPDEDKPVIKIADPGKVMAGTEVKFTADMADISWSVYNYMNDTNGYAVIDEDTGILKAYSTGVVRIAATSNTDNKVYGAVDVTVYGKKFVKAEALDTITINSDQKLATVGDLINAGILPAKINLIYETGEGTATETVSADLSTYWYGNYNGEISGKYLLKTYIQVPTGYSNPSAQETTVCVEVKAPQTNVDKEVTEYGALDTLIIDTDENLVSFSQVFNKYLSGKELTLKCEDGSEITGIVNSWLGGEAEQYNGAVAGSYKASLYLDLPNGYYYNQVNYKTSTSIYWSETDYISVPMKIVVQTPQTGPNGGDGYSTPAATQQKFSHDTAVTVNSVSLTGAPVTAKAGDIVDFGQYLTVDTASGLASDHAVYWTLDGYNAENLNAGTGSVLLREEGTYVIKAISVADKTKSASVTVTVTGGKQVTVADFTAINIDQDLNIIDFNSLYEKYKAALPKFMNGIDEEGNSVKYHINGWYLYSKTSNTIVISPNYYSIYGYHITGNVPALTFNITAAQTDNRTKVTSATAVSTGYTVNSDQYAVTEGELYSAVLGQYSNITVAVNATLEDGSQILLQCPVATWSITPNDYPEGYFGTKGQVTFDLGLVYPDGYTAKTKENDSVDIYVHIPVTITVDQTPQNERVWVIQKPELSYSLGDKFDLSTLKIRLRDNSNSNGPTDTYVMFDDFNSYGIELRLSYVYGEEVTKDTVVSEDMEGMFLYIYDTNRDTYTFFGPIKLKKQEITGFKNQQISDGAVNHLYYDTIEEVQQILPVTVTSLEGVVVPVISWNVTGNADNFGSEAATYTFTAKLGAIPDGYVLGEGVTATCEVTVADTLNIEAIQELTDINIPLGSTVEDLHLPKSIDVTLSDGNTINQGLPVSWDTDSFNPAQAGTYTITGTILNTTLTNTNNLVPSVNVIVTFDDTAVLDSISIIDQPGKILYKVGDSLDPQGLRITGKYSDGSSAEIAPASCNISGLDSAAEGIKYITVEYQGLTDSFAVYVDSTATDNYTVLFSTDKDTLQAVSVVTGGAIGVNLPVSPEKTGYTFKGWYDMGSVEVTAAYVPTEDTVVYASWESKLKLSYLGANTYYTGVIMNLYQLFIDGVQTTISSAVGDGAYARYGTLYIDMYNITTGEHVYHVTDNSGNTYEFTLFMQGTQSVEAVAQAGTVIINSEEYKTYKVFVAPAEVDVLNVSSYNTTCFGSRGDDGSIIIGVPVSAVPGTYDFIIYDGGNWYKTQIVIS